MNFRTATSLIAFASHMRLSLAGNSAFIPNRVSYESLTSDPLLSPDESVLVDALAKDGLLSVTDIPGFGTTKRELMTYLHSCIMEQGTAFPQELMKDNTVRRTIATATVPGPGGAQPVNFKEGEPLSESCQRFSEHLEDFRTTVEQATAAFADRLSFEMGSSLSAPLMSTEDGAHSFQHIKDVVASGEHLEHFHSYQKTESTAMKQTIDIHVDQGFFIAFTPGLIVSHTEVQKPDLSKPLVESEGFYVQTSDGKRSLVTFDAKDDLVFMMGDGVNQYINTKLAEDSLSAQKKLRATPHAVSLTTHDSSYARVWYGRMVLPPKDAFNPVTSQTYGNVRDLLISLRNEKIPQGVGCSSSTMRALHQNSNGETSCDAGEFFCWARCMSLDEYNIVDETTCTDQGLDLKCINPRGQHQNVTTKHGDYYPACTNTTELATEYPTLPNFPQDAVTCTDDKWRTFSSNDGFDHEFDLSDGANTVKLMWTVNDDKTVTTRLVSNDLFGWLALGFPNPDPNAGHNGMNGADILLALPGGEYSAQTGLDMSLESTVKEYVISSGASAFRHWKEPQGGSNPDAQVTIDSDACFASMDFTGDNINGKSIDVSGSTYLLWATNGVDTFVGYHGFGKKNRALFTVEWASGKAYFGKTPPEPTTSSASRLCSALTKTAIIAALCVYIL